MLQRTRSYVTDCSRTPDVTPRTREILSNERRYGDRLPHWPVGKLQRPAQTSDEAYHERLRLVKRVRRHAADKPEAQALGDRLNSCAPNRRCMSGGCPECSRAFTRWFVASASAILQSLDTSVSVVSLVHANIGVPTGKLKPEHIRTVNRKIPAILTPAGVTTFLGGVDFSANEEHDGTFDPYWQPQSWILAQTHEVRRAEPKLRVAFPKTDTTPRPVKIKEWDGNLAALGYALKNTFDRRVSFLCEDKFGLRKPYRNTRDRNLRVEQHIELMIALDQAGLHARLHLGGCRVVHTARGPEIRMIKGKSGREGGDQ